eukprot:gnl/TRDRNA2_/TRDRNA2_173787_c0_seq1.p1 gnl/TRDRNA2_/TRDRNA2_173787_c0~~gnl/TRDRNA2_/TRDRNA2_173787_c0_seq1.p1  ORF type:complete len:516 (-),score=60.44 gnl/TRDRNA2_/TRDRNA2_173787_c0_seq1:62-1609(-)
MSDEVSWKGAAHIGLQMKGSVLPTASKMAIPCALVSIVLKALAVNKVEAINDILGFFQMNSAAYAQLCGLLTFLIVFRTSQAYSRYVAGGTLVHQMMGEWFDSASSLISFCRCSKVDKSRVQAFKHTLIRLFSLMHACGIDQLGRDTTDQSAALLKIDVIDLPGLNPESLAAVMQVDCKVELIMHWIQCLVLENLSAGVIAAPPPICGRAFQELSNGAVKLHDATKFSHLPFPFPYSQATIWLLIVHWIITPFVICGWTENIVLAGLISFIMVLQLWSLYAISNQLENPFGGDEIDVDMVEMQHEMNKRLLLLVQPGAMDLPVLTDSANMSLKLSCLRGGFSITRTQALEKLPDPVISQVKMMFGLEEAKTQSTEDGKDYTLTGQLRTFSARELLEEDQEEAAGVGLQEPAPDIESQIEKRPEGSVDSQPADSGLCLADLSVTGPSQDVAWEPLPGPQLIVNHGCLRDGERGAPYKHTSKASNGFSQYFMQPLSTSCCSEDTPENGARRPLGCAP